MTSIDFNFLMALIPASGGAFRANSLERPAGQDAMEPLEQFAVHSSADEA